MCREFFSVGTDECGKYVQYNGFLWKRDNADEERGENGELLDYAFTYGDIGRVHLSEVCGDPLQAVMERFDVCQQYQEDLSEGQWHARMNCFYGAAQGACLHMSDTSERTPDGDYFFDYELDKPRFTYVSSKEFAAYVDTWDTASAGFLKGLLTSEGLVVDFERAEFEECVFELTREFLIPILEQFGFSERPDGTEF